MTFFVFFFQKYAEKCKRDELCRKDSNYCRLSWYFSAVNLSVAKIIPRIRSEDGLGGAQGFRCRCIGRN
jgi:hypothetical protein